MNWFCIIAGVSFFLAAMWEFSSTADLRWTTVYFCLGVVNVLLGVK